jgi:hypothetical protein
MCDKSGKNDTSSTVATSLSGILPAPPARALARTGGFVIYFGSGLSPPLPHIHISSLLSFPSQTYLFLNSRYKSFILVK